MYVRDASGNVMSVYEQTGSGATAQIETDLYGSSRLGLQTGKSIADVSKWNGTATLSTFTRGEKIFELSNHLGNVLVTVNDKKVQHTTDNSTVDYWEADVMSANDYYPFGMSMPGRGYNASSYRYGFNGKEDDNDITNGGQDYGMRIYDKRLGRFLSVDPLTREYPWYTPYQFAGNKPIEFTDRDGEEEHDPQLRDDLDYLSGRKSESQYRENQTARGMGVLIAGAIMADIYLFKGKATQTLFVYAPVLGALEHNVAKTNEGKRAQVARAKENLSTGLVNYGLGVLLGKIYKAGSQFFREVKTAYEPPSVNSNCFVAGTKVLTSSGLKSIEDLVVGDSVWSYNEITGRIALKQVEALYKKSVRQLVRLLFDEEAVCTTSEHPFWVNNTWIQAKDISISDSVMLFSKSKRAVTAKRLFDTAAMVYNFTVSEYHTYYVTILGILVHNACFEPVAPKEGGGAQLNKAIKEIDAGGGTPRVNAEGNPVTFEGRTAKNGKAWAGATEYQVLVPGKGNVFRILKLQTGVDADGAPTYKYGYSTDHYQTTIHEFKPAQPPPQKPTP